MERPIVSVIIPAYNICEYIEKAVDSICSQSLTDWEMLLIDDGSTDETGDICDSLAFADSRIRVIHQENQGAAAARNLGIEKSAGKYLYFMDGDDWASSDMLYDMVCLAEHYYLDAWAGVPVNNKGRDLDSLGRAVQSPSEFIADEPEDRCAQMVITGFYIETYSSESDYYIQKQSVRSRVFADKSEFRNKAHELFDKNLLYTPWNKLYLASYIKDNDIRFVKKHWDDFPFNLDVIRNVERVTVSDSAYYHFIRKRPDSESEKYNVSLYTEREEEHSWLLGLYETWRGQELEKYLKKLKDMPDSVSFLEEPEETNLLTGTVGYVSLKDTQETQTVEASQSAQEPDEAAGSEAQPAEQGMSAAGSDAQPEAFFAAGDSENGSADENIVTAKGAYEPSEGGDAADADFGDDEVDSREDEAETTDVVTAQNMMPAAANGPAFNFPPAEAKEFIARRYVERIIGCIENISNPASGLSAREKMEKIRAMIGKDSVRQALKVAKPKSLHMKAMLLPIKMKATAITYLEGELITKVKSRNATLFAKLKNNR